MRLKLQLATLFLITACLQQNPKEFYPRIIMDIPNHPLVFELDVGETYTINRIMGDVDKSATIKIVDYKFHYENNLWFRDTIPQKNIYQADVSVKINGKAYTLTKRGYQFPQVMEGFRWYVETIRGWETSSQVDAFKDLEKDIRLSVCLENESWGPEDFAYPIKDYRWRASSYMNTWSAMVPYNLFYYHRGDDMGVIPDKLDVVALCKGSITDSPYPDGDGASNGLHGVGKDRFGFRYAHMNTETFLPTSAEGQEVRAGQILGKTGETWNGYRSQHADPHLHVSLDFKGTRISTYPYLMEAYFRDYSDKVLAVAGGFRFGIIGDTIVLDGARSLAANGEEISEKIWLTHEGDTIRNTTCKLVFKETGLFSEQLVVKTAGGSIDRDFLQVRIYDPEKDGRDIVRGFVHYWPVRNIYPGDSILFWNRISGNYKPVQIDFGDGSPSEIIDDEIRHVYNSPGKYVVTFTSSGKDDEPATVQLEVVVE
jgi:hypothetical protein